MVAAPIFQREVMQLYDVKVRLAGNVNNEVRKTGVSAAEVVLLRLFQGGDDCVVDIVPTGTADWDDDVERERLMRNYINNPRNNAKQIEQKTRAFRDLFGHDSNPLPKRLKGVDHNDPKPVRTKISAPAAE